MFTTNSFLSFFGNLCVVARLSGQIRPFSLPCRVLCNFSLLLKMKEVVRQEFYRLNRHSTACSPDLRTTKGKRGRWLSCNSHVNLHLQALLITLEKKNCLSVWFYYLLIIESYAVFSPFFFFHSSVLLHT